MDNMQHYVVLMRNRRLWIVGPFITQDAAAEWGRRTQTAGNDDPRWQTIELPDSWLDQNGHPHPTIVVDVIRPDHSDAAENGQPD